MKDSCRSIELSEDSWRQLQILAQQQRATAEEALARLIEEAVAQRPLTETLPRFTIN